MSDSPHTLASQAPPEAFSGSAIGSRPGGVTASDREKFGPEELAVVLSHYDLGTVESVREFPRGSRKAPKAIIRCEKGSFLLKRRARGKDDAYRVAFAHSLQLFLASRQFPLPHLVGTRKDNNSMLQWGGGVYEVFEYIQGTGYDNSPESSRDAGKVLGLFHKLARDFQPEFESSSGSYHSSRTVNGSFDQIPIMLAQADPRTAAQESGKINEVKSFLSVAYKEAALRVNEMGLPDWPMQIVHCDWHPGNMLFRKTRVVGVIDYDAARLQQRIIDVANGALQFSILGGGDDASQWPEYVDEARYREFLRGYDEVNVLSSAELGAMPWLMVEALIAETVIPIAATGSFAKMEGFGFLLMVERKVRWLRKNAEKLANILAG